MVSCMFLRRSKTLSLSLHSFIILMMGDKKFGERFFCPLLPGFSKKLLVPQELAKNIFVDESRQTVTLVTHNGKICHLELHKEVQDYYIGGKGWEDYVKEHGLENYDMLVFRFRGNMVFTLRVFDKMTCCEKMYSYSSPMVVEENSIFVDSDDDGTSNVVPKNPTTSFCKKRKKLSHTSEHRMTLRSQDQVPAKNYSRKLSFEGTLRASYFGRRMYIPTTFRESTCLERVSEVTLVDPNGRCWTVGVTNFHKHGYNSTETFLSKGWQDFSVSNDLQEGDKCIFELLLEENSNIVIRVEILERRKQLKSICGGE